MPPSELPRVLIQKNQTPSTKRFYDEMGDHFSASSGTTMEKLANFARFVPIGDVGRFLAKSKIFEQILTVHGHIVECGVFMGGGLMTWAQLSAIFEPLNHIRRVIGFDTFAGFPSVSAQDRATGDAVAQAGGLRSNSYDEIRESVRLYDLYRPLGHIEKVQLVRGKFEDSLPAYLEENPQTLIALLYLDFDLYEPTKFAITTLLKRMPKGAVIAFDELNHPQWPGETSAVLDSIGVRNLRIQRFPFQPQISYAVLE